MTLKSGSRSLENRYPLNHSPERYPAQWRAAATLTRRHALAPAANPALCLSEGGTMHRHNRLGGWLDEGTRAQQRKVLKCAASSQTFRFLLTYLRHTPMMPSPAARSLSHNDRESGHHRMGHQITIKQSTSTLCLRANHQPGKRRSCCGFGLRSVTASTRACANRHHIGCRGRHLVGSMLGLSTN